MPLVNRKQPSTAASKPGQTLNSKIWFEQFKMLLLLLLKLKAARFATVFIPIALVASSLYIVPLLGDIKSETGKNGSDQRVFYSASDFAASKAKVLVDRSSFPAETAAAISIMKAGGGDANWIEECGPEADCRERFINLGGHEAIVALIRYSKKPDESRAVLECLHLHGAKVDIRCAFLYKVMVLSIQATLGFVNFKEIQMFQLFEKYSNNSDQVERYDNEKTKSLPNSVCANGVKKDTFSQLTSMFVRISVSLSAIGVNFYLLISTVSCIRMIKTDGFLQQLFRSGLSVSAYWLVIWLVTALECLFFAGVFTASNALECLGVFPASAMARVFIFFALFCLNLAAFMLLLELLLPPLALVSMMTIVMSIGLLVASFNSTFLQEQAKFLLYIFSPLFATEYIIKLFNSEVRRQFSVAELKHEDDSERLSQILTWTAIGLLLFALLLTYLDFMLSSGNGLCLPPHYPFMPDFWCPKGHKDRSDSAPSQGPAEKTELNIEPVMGLQPVVLVKDVSKKYQSCCFFLSDGPTVLKRLSCTIYRGQITALIGHNGAGKSTLIRILTGEELPDEGTAHIGDCLVTNPLLRLSLRGRISTCPQFDALCDSLTVMECIRVTLVSRAASDTSQLERARGMLQRLGLGDKEDVLSCDLSGGQKRKVSTILALLGDPDVVFLDEPTSGLDPVSRRQLWQLLQEEKSARSIILCTQFMDEADILADRKIFLCGGKIVCAGSSMFLKRAFGCSFTLNVSLKSQSGAESLLAKLKQVRLKSREETELQLEVPALNSSVLTEAVQVLETSREVETFGLSQASLDDIFMRLLPAFIFGTVSNLLTVYAIAVLTRKRSTLVSTGCVLVSVLLPSFVVMFQNFPVYLKLLIWIVPTMAPITLMYFSTEHFLYKLAYYQIIDGSELPGMIDSLWTNSGIFHSLIAMPVHIIILLGIIFAVEESAAIKEAVCHRGAQTKPDKLDSDMEDGAKKEAERVLAAPRSSKNVLEVRQLQKIYPNGVNAVRGVTFGAMAGEIFGLLGANGAGKSTSMSVIVGEEAATEGVCEVRVQDGAWLSGREGSTVGAIGYCPQHNPLFNSITVAEHIRFYADIRGLDSIEAERQTTRLMQSLGLSQHSDKQAGQLSGGNKRRLCLAIALLGDPALIVIDEASTGVDPENKRFIWGAIRRMVHKQRSVMVTTHSMEEVEALCSRVGIMNKGRMISVGTVQQLLSRYGDAYTLELLLAPETEPVVRQKKLIIKKVVSEQFKGAQTQEDLGIGLVMQFSLPKSSVRSLSGALRWISVLQSRLGVSYWALYQISLDQVFVKLVKMFDRPVPKPAGRSQEYFRRRHP